ncbi:MAG: TlpA family protein disulfide reductase [Acidobacteriota bacterium]|nr:TlpA family protein disulfide reductase [Acidobacteriota bacterium]
MKNLFTNIVLFVWLSIVFSGFTACSNTASTQKGPVSETAPSDQNGNAVETIEASKRNFPPVPTGISQSEIKDLEGNTFKIEDKKGKVVLINLWATWCGPCRAEMPELVAMQEKYRDKGFEVIGLDSDDESVEEIKAFAEKMKLNYQLGYADGKMLSEFIKITRLSGIPQTMIINREGKMVLVIGGGGTRAVNNIKEAVEKTVNEL